MITTLVFLHCIVCSSLMYGFWLPRWYLLAIVLSVLLWCTASDYHVSIFTLYCLFFGNQNPYIKEEQTIQCNETNVVIRNRTSKKNRQCWYLYIVLSVLLWCTASDYHVSIFTLYCLFFFDVRLLITTLVSCT
jgi:hypothetical protein